MYSSSNSFLGSANSARPGQQSPFGQQPVFSQFPQGQQQQLQPTGLAPQPTGFPGAPLQPQFTSFPGPAAPQQSYHNFGPPQPQQQSHLQPQFTGFPSQSQPPQLPLQQSAPQQFPASTGAPPSIAPQKTSSQIALSFQDTDASSRPPLPPKTGSKIPNIRLSFITAQDQAKFEQLFKAAVGDSQTLDGWLQLTEDEP
jgi:hypothetical protein